MILMTTIKLSQKSITKRIFFNSQNWKYSNTFVNNLYVTGEIIMEIIKYFKLSNNESTTLRFKNRNKKIEVNKKASLQKHMHNSNESQD